VKVGVSGASGRMGSLAAKAFSETDDLHLIALYDRYMAGSIAGLSISQDPEALDGCDVILEFSSPTSVMDHLAHWRQFGANVVVGTSGFDAERLAALGELWGNGPGNCLVVPNFSIGGVLMMKMAEMAAKYFKVGEIIEMHHDRKIDAPSGTAIATAARIAKAGGAQQRAVESEEFHGGALGATIDGVSVHSIRMPGLLAHQVVMFGSEGETLSLRHDTMDRNAFLPGILLAVRSVSTQQAPLAVGLESLLGI